MLAVKEIWFLELLSSPSCVSKVNAAEGLSLQSQESGCSRVLSPLAIYFILFYINLVDIIIVIIFVRDLYGLFTSAQVHQVLSPRVLVGNRMYWHDSLPLCQKQFCLEWKPQFLFVFYFPGE